jgi:hypothetical protein
MPTLKEKTDLMLDMLHLYEWYLHHLEEKLELIFWNQTSGSLITDAIKKKF